MTTVDLLETDQVVFPKLGLEFSINDTAFTLFNIDFKWYGILITLGMALALIYGFSQMKKYGVDTDRAFDAVIGGIIGGLVGARAYYVIMKWENYSDNLLSIFNIRRGGLAIYGGIIGALLVGGIIAKIRKLKLLPLFDVVGIGLLLGQGIGRWGNFTNQEAFGCNTQCIFGMSSGKIQQWIAQNGESATLSAGETLELSQPVHPCFFYESVWCLLGFVLLAIFAKKIRKFDGQIFLIYISWYGLGRFFIEGLRTDSLMIGSLRVSQALAALCVVVSIILQIIITLKVRRMGDDYKLYVDTEESKQLIRESKEKIKNRSRTHKKNSEESFEDENSKNLQNSEQQENLNKTDDQEENNGETN